MPYSCRKHCGKKEKLLNTMNQNATLCGNGLWTHRKKHLENTVGKGENAVNQYFFYFTPCFFLFPKTNSYICILSHDWFIVCDIIISVISYSFIITYSFSPMVTMFRLVTLTRLWWERPPWLPHTKIPVDPLEANLQNIVSRKLAAC